MSWLPLGVHSQTPYISGHPVRNRIFQRAGAIHKRKPWPGEQALECYTSELPDVSED
jgi:hypothetical protein